MRFSEAIMWGDSFIQATLKHREASLKDFVKVGGNSELHRAKRILKLATLRLLKSLAMEGIYPQVSLRKALPLHLERVLVFT